MLGAIVSAATFDGHINIAAQKYGVEPALIRAHIKAESNWDPSASRYEAHLNDSSLGLMQVLLRTAREQLKNQSLTAEQLLDPIVNIDVGTKYIAYQLSRYNGNVLDAIAAYNAGSARKTASGNYVNQAYVDKVYNYYKQYAAQPASQRVAQSMSTASSMNYALLALGGILLVSAIVFIRIRRSRA